MGITSNHAEKGERDVRRMQEEAVAVALLTGRESYFPHNKPVPTCLPVRTTPRLTHTIMT